MSTADKTARERKAAEGTPPLTKDEVDNGTPNIFGYRWCETHEQAETRDALPVHAYDEPVDEVVNRIYDAAMKVCGPMVSIPAEEDSSFIVVKGWRVFTDREAHLHRQAIARRAEQQRQRDEADAERLRRTRPDLLA